MMEQRGRAELIIFVVILITGQTAADLQVYSSITWDSIRGNITFLWPGIDQNVTIHVDLEIAGPLIDSQPVEYDWAIYEIPVIYGTKERCSPAQIGQRKWDLSKILGKLQIPSISTQIFSTNELEIIGQNSIWGRSIKIFGNGKSSCSNIHGIGVEKTYESRFFSPMGGSIWIRTWAWNIASAEGESGLQSDLQSGLQTLIMTDVFHTSSDKPNQGDHDWSIFITDILDGKQERTTCNFLNRIYDPRGREKCDENGDCPIGDLSNTFGHLRVGTTRSRFSRKTYVSTDLIFPDLSGPRQLYIAVMGALHPDHLWACAKLRLIKPRHARALFGSLGVQGEIRISQGSIFTPSELTLDLVGLKGMAGGFHVHQLPALPPRNEADFHCGATKGHYNPFGMDPDSSPMPGLGTHDHYELGDLSGKHGQLLGLTEVAAAVTDHNLPLFGPHSVMGRSLVIHKADGGARWVCANLRPTVPQIRAVVTFRYPLVGEIVFEQDESDPLADTTVLVRELLYSDGSRNSTDNHRWHIHNDIPGRDFYNWTMRCVSAGPHYNPHKVTTEERPYRGCKADNPQQCELGDLATRLGPLKVSGTVKELADTKKLLTDTNLPLSGPYSILGHSVVIHDDHAPKHRGDRMACAGIYRLFRHKGVVNKWYSTKGAGEVEGKLEFIQETEYDITNTEVDLRGLEAIASGYHVHMVPVEHELEFPCEGSTTLGHFNPLNMTPADSPPPGKGTHDLYEMGDLAGKYGTLEGKLWKKEYYNDTNLQLFGPTSIMGRSIVIHKKIKNARWFCGSIGWGYSPAEATQVSAIASFHNPQGYAWGYIRMRQLVYRDGNYGETFLEVNLRHPGSNNRNLTRKHNWSVYVNPVGVDAGVKFFQSRCVAAGYRWNPYLIHLAFPNDRDFYERECGPTVPLRCDVGDLSGRLGTIDVGDKRYVFVDRNLPLSGPHGIMNRAIIIHKENAGVERFACANIEPDDDIIKWVIVRKTPKFSVTTFMSEVRDVLGAPEWYLAADLHTMSISSDQQCVTFVVHFMGPQANRLELDFSRLLAGGILSNPTISIRGVYPDPDRKKKVPYRTCGGLEEEHILEELEGNKWWEVLTGEEDQGGVYSKASTPYIYLYIIFVILQCIIL